MTKYYHFIWIPEMYFFSNHLYHQQVRLVWKARGKSLLKFDSAVVWRNNAHPNPMWSICIGNTFEQLETAWKAPTEQQQ